MKRALFFMNLLMLLAYKGLVGECDFPGQRCVKPLYCGIAQVCPFGESKVGVCDANLVCIAEGDSCVIPNREDFSISIIKGAYKKNPDGVLYCSPVIR